MFRLVMLHVIDLEMSGFSLYLYIIYIIFINYIYIIYHIINKYTCIILGYEIPGFSEKIILKF